MVGIMDINLSKENTRHAVELASSTSKDLVIFDIEHTGGTKETRGITELAALVIDQSGCAHSFSSFVKPWEHAQFNPYVVDKTGITPEKVKNAPAWSEVFEAFVNPHKNSIWIGFNSVASDIPIMTDECERLGISLDIESHIDIRRASGIKGSLEVNINKRFPNLDTSANHRALFDAYLTLLLTESLANEGLCLRSCLEGTSMGFGPRTNDLFADKKINNDSIKKVQSCFPVGKGVTRKGEYWTDSEYDWISERFISGASVDQIAKEIGRTTYAAACGLNKLNLICEEEKDRFHPSFRFKRNDQTNVRSHRPQFA